MTRYFLIGLFLLLLAVQAEAIGVDNVSSAGNFSLGGVRVAPVTQTHTISSAQEVLYVGVSNAQTLVGGICTLTPGGTVPPNGISYGARTDFQRYTTRTTTLNAVVSPNLCATVEVFRLVNPPTGTNTLSVTVTGGGDYVVIGAISFTGVDATTTTAGMLDNASGNSASPSVIVQTPNNGIVLDVIAAEFNAGQALPSQTLQYDGAQFFGFLNSVGAASTKARTGATTTTNWLLANPGNWALGGVAIKESPTAAPASIGGRIETATGEPIANVFVRVQNLETGESFETTTDAKGAFYFEELEAARVYQIRASSKLYTFAPNNRVVSLSASLDNVNFQAAPRRGIGFAPAILH